MIGYKKEYVFNRISNNLLLITNHASPSLLTHGSHGNPMATPPPSSVAHCDVRLELHLRQDEEHVLAHGTLPLRAAGGQEGGVWGQDSCGLIWGRGGMTWEMRDDKFGM